MPRISQLPSLTAADNADELAIVDVSASTTKKITRGDLLKAPLPTNSVTDAAILDSSISATKQDFTTWTPTTSSGWTISADGRRAMRRVSTTGLQTFGAGTTSAAFWYQEFTVALPTGFTVANSSVNVTRVVAGEAEAKLTVGFNQTTGKFWMANTGSAAIGATSTTWINDILLEKKV